jgi:hypothetical protein
MRHKVHILIDTLTSILTWPHSSLLHSCRMSMFIKSSK